jgi:hypothetical protein
VETAANVNPLTAAGTRRRNMGHSAKNSSSTLIIGIVGGVFLLGAVAFFVIRGNRKSETTTNQPVASTKLQEGVVLQVKDVQWQSKAEGVWTVSGTVVNGGKKAAEKVVVAFYPCGPDSRVKDKTGFDIAVVTAAKLPTVGPGQSVRFTTTPNPPAIKADGSMTVFPADRSQSFIGWRDGTSLPKDMQEALFDPLDRDDWGGEETELAKKRKRGSGAK